MTTPPDLDDEEGGLQAFLQELSRLEEVSHQRTQELRCAQQAEQALQKELETALFEMHIERQATLQLELESANAEVHTRMSRDHLITLKKVMEEVEQQISCIKEMLEKCSVERSGSHEGKQKLPTIEFDSRASLKLSLQCISENARLCKEYFYPLYQLLQQLYVRFQKTATTTAAECFLVNDLTSEEFTAFLDRLSNFSECTPFADAERVVLTFVQHSGSKY